LTTKILVVDDEATLLDTLRYNLVREGYEVLTAEDGEKAIELARKHLPDLIVLDLMLPKIDGLGVCRVLRREMTTPILMLTARDDEVDKVVGLELGADDYVTKPFGLRELIARIRALIRRAQPGDSPAPAESEKHVFRFGDLIVDEGAHRVQVRGADVTLKPKEFDLLAFMARNRGQALSRDVLLERVWGYEFFGDTRTVDVHVRWLREKIEEDPSHPRRIQTVRGLGYKFEA
jgi:DNA-binding response OmpR family regulator